MSQYIIDGTIWYVNLRTYFVILQMRQRLLWQRDKKKKIKHKEFLLIYEPVAFVLYINVCEGWREAVCVQASGLTVHRLNGSSQ